MKLLQNPVVVGLLVLAAAAMVFYNAVWPSMKRNGWGRSKPRSSAPAVQGAKAAANPRAAAEQLASQPRSAQAPAPSPTPAPGTATPEMALIAIDTPVVWANANRWRTAPRRDPFHSRLFDAKDKNARPAQELLTLKGTWRQEGGKPLAVINDQVVATGDLVQGYTVDAIEDNRVWVNGPNGREALNFKLILPATTELAPETLPEAPKAPELPKDKPVETAFLTRSQCKTYD